MLEPFPRISGAADAAAVQLRRTGFNVHPTNHSPGADRRHGTAGAR